MAEGIIEGWLMGSTATVDASQGMHGTSVGGGTGVVVWAIGDTLHNCVMQGGNLGVVGVKSHSVVDARTRRRGSSFTFSLLTLRQTVPEVAFPEDWQRAARDGAVEAVRIVTQAATKYTIGTESTSCVLCRDVERQQRLAMAIATARTISLGAVPRFSSTGLIVNIDGLAKARGALGPGQGGIDGLIYHGQDRNSMGRCPLLTKPSSVTFENEARYSESLPTSVRQDGEKLLRLTEYYDADTHSLKMPDTSNEVV